VTSGLLLVVQADSFNKSRIATVRVAVITSNLASSESPENVCIGKSDSKLTKASVVNVTQTLTLDRRCLTKRAGHLPNVIMNRVSEGLSLVLGL